jgi:hypothetical protein
MLVELREVIGHLSHRSLRVASAQMLQEPAPRLDQVEPGMRPKLVYDDAKDVGQRVYGDDHDLILRRSCEQLVKVYAVVEPLAKAALARQLFGMVDVGFEGVEVRFSRTIESWMRTRASVSSASEM